MYYSLVVTRLIEICLIGHFSRRLSPTLPCPIVRFLCKTLSLYQTLHGHRYKALSFFFVRYHFSLFTNADDFNQQGGGRGKRQHAGKPPTPSFSKAV